MPDPLKDLIDQRLGTPVRFEEFLRFRTELNQMFAAVWGEMDSMNRRMITLSAELEESSRGKSLVERTLEVAEKKSGRKVEIIAEVVFPRNFLEAELGVDIASSLLGNDDALNFQGIHAIVLESEAEGRILARTLTKVPLLIWLSPDEVKELPDGDVFGVLVAKASDEPEEDSPV